MERVSATHLRMHPGCVKNKATVFFVKNRRHFPAMDILSGCLLHRQGKTVHLDTSQYQPNGHLLTNYNNEQYKSNHISATKFLKVGHIATSELAEMGDAYTSGGPTRVYDRGPATVLAGQTWTMFVKDRG